MEVALHHTLTVHTVYTIQMALLYTPLNMYAYMSQLLLLGKFVYGGGLIFKVVPEC